MPRHPLRDDDSEESNEPYIEPDPDDGVWPEHWTPHQRKNWINHGQDTYAELETDLGRYWYRRCWRPKQRNEGLMETDEVKLGNPEDYVVENVGDYLSPMGDMTSVMMRQLSRYSVDTDDLDEAVEDIVQAKVATMSEEAQRRLLQQSQRLAKIYGVDQ